MKLTLHPNSRTGYVIKAYLKSGFKVENLIQVENGKLTAYLSGKGVRVFIDENGLTKFASRFAKAA